MPYSKPASQDFVGTNDQWSGVETGYAPGMVWVESIFSHIPRDPIIYGPTYPLEEIPPAGPFDDEEGAQAWRKSHHGTHIYTGESIIHVPPPPRLEQRVRRMQFWANYDARARQSATASTRGQYQGQTPTAAGEEQYLLDELQSRSNPTTTPTLSLSASSLQVVASAQQVVTPSPVNTTASPPAPAPIDNRSNVDGEHEPDDDFLPNAPQESSAITGHTREHMTPKKMSSPRGVDDWDDYNLLSLWKFKVVRKKGYEPMLATFKNQTVKSLRETWRKNKKRCQELGIAWEAAGKPSGALGDWFEE